MGVYVCLDVGAYVGVVLVWVCTYVGVVLVWVCMWCWCGCVCGCGVGVGVYAGVVLVGVCVHGHKSSLAKNLPLHIGSVDVTISLTTAGPIDTNSFGTDWSLTQHSASSQR